MVSGLEQVYLMVYLDLLRPFVKALKGAIVKGWGLKCVEAFQAIKECIASSLSLSQPVDWEKLYLYLSTSTMTVSVALVRLDYDKRQRLVYFVNKALTEVETRNSDFERVALALQMATKKLQPYFQAHTVVVLTGLPIKAILHKSEASRRLLK